ncbi:antA/AntB antirepressor family protein [Spirosoma pollinicola]|uniref:AntA/AntB antirepressor domain-containing protein n=1 Tax=Spirosoma pollinicola TaxID=2057025 RepID=A0A2K8ZAS1_9BACT|nr:antA/AntB antirepressor family protein [Spirosoma pollinicola]AUD06986.1 hypothetical protein CWM47_37315 [Spirosoma pollinicola]
MYEVCTTLAHWSKKNIVNNQFDQENVDWIILDIMSSSNNGSMTTDYELTFDFAERLSMVAQTDKGEEIRRWFQSLKKKVEALPASQDDLILMLAQRNVETAKRLSVIEERLDRFEQIQQTAATELLALPAPTEPMAEIPTESQIIRLVNSYSQAKSVAQPEVWRKLYTELLYRYRISVNAYKRPPGESKIQMLKRVGHLDKLYVVATNVLQMPQANA